MRMRNLLLSACVALGVLSGCAERADPVVPLVPQKAAQKRTAEGLEALKAQFAGKPLTVSEVSERDIDGASALVIAFSAPLDPEQALERLVSVVDDKGARLEGGWERSEDLREIRRRPLEPGRRLTVAVAPATRSIAGVPLGEAHRAELTTRDQPATIGFASRGTLLPTRLAEGLPVIALNVSKVEVEFHRLRPERLHAFLGDWNRQSALDIWQLGDLSASADLVYTGHFSLESRPNTRERQVLPVDGIKALSAPGVYLAVMRPSGQWRGTLPVTVFTRSDIGLSVRRGARTLDNFVQSLESGRALSNVKVELIDEKGLKLADGFSNGNGHVQLPLHAQGRMVLATHGNDTSLVALGDPALDLAEFKVDGPVAGPLSLFVFGPRDLYRPGETVPFNALLRDADGRAVPPQPVKATLVRPDGEAARSFVWEAGADGLYQTRYTLADDAAGGRWQLRLDLGGMKVVHEFLVEDFLPERLALELSAAPGPLASADVPQITAQGRYLHGAPASGNRMIGQLFVAPLREAVPALPGFQFGDAAEQGLERMIELEERWLDDDGAGEWTLGNEWGGARSPLELTLQASVQESGGRPVTRRLSLPVWPAERLVGIRPLFNGTTVDTGSDARFEIVVADRAGQRLAAEGLEVRLVQERRDYFWQFSEYEGWSSQFNQKDVTLSSALHAVTPDAKLEVALPVEWGGYRVEVHDPQTGLVSSVRFQAGYDWQQNAEEGAVRPDQVRLALDKPRYQAGEVAQLRVEPPAAGKGYLAVESADGVLWWQAIDVPAEGKSFPLPIPQDWARHDLYVSALVVRPGERAAHVVPRRAVGLLHLPLDREARRLAVTLEAPAKMRPGRALPVKVSVPGQAGRAVRVLVSAVDVGILNLTRFATPDPFEAFFGRRGYAIDQLDVYGQLIEVGAAKRGRLAFGGDAERDRGGRAPISSVTLVSLQAQPVLLDANGEGEVRLDIPDFNGELRIMAQAWSDEAYGMAEGSTVVAAPVLVDLAAPRFLAGGDRSQLAVDISNLTDTQQTLRPSLEVDGLLRAEGGLPGEIVLAPGKRHTLQVPVSAAAGSGAGTIRIGLAGVVLPDEVAEPVSRSWTIGVRPAWPAVTETHAAALQPGTEAWSLAAQSPRFAQLEDRRVRVNLAARPPLNLAEHVAQLLAYPYGCAEQTTSGLYPSLYARPEVLAALGIRGEAGDARRAKIERGIERLLAMQRYNGSFGLWNRDGDEEYWLSAYVSDFLLRALEEGFAVPEAALEQARARLLAYVQNEHLIEIAYSDDDRRSRFAVQAYAAYVLARSGQAPLGALRQIHERRAQAPSGLALAQLGFALARMGDGERGNALLREAIARPGGERSARSWYADYGSALRDTALLLALLEEHQLLPGERPGLYLTLADMLKRDEWLSTQERNALFLAGRQALVQPGEAWSAEVAAREVQALSAELPRTVVIDEPGLGGDLRITNQGGATLFQRLTLTGYPREPLPADAQHIAVERRVLRPDGTLVEGPLASGELVLVHLSVRAATRVHDALVVDLLPAGLELENQRLDASARLPAANEEINALLQRREEIVVAHEGFMADRYVAAVELPEGQRVDLLYLARAVTPGAYRVPPPLVESMYSPAIQGRGATPGALTIEARQR